MAPEMESLYIQSRTLEAKDLEWIRQLIDAHPGWNRTKLSVHTAQRIAQFLCLMTLKAQSARTTFLKLSLRALSRRTKSRIQKKRIIPT